MNAFITLIIFTLPGLLTYFWINLFGVTPTEKRSNSEVTAISALLLIPVIGTVFLVYNMLALISRGNFNIPFIKGDWRYIGKIKDIVSLADSMWFIILYVILTIVVSYILALVISKYLFPLIIMQINKVRVKNNIAPLGKHPTVWNSMFMNNDKQIIKYKKQGEDSSLIGNLVKVPRANEVGKSIVLEAVEHWTNIIDYYDVQIDYTYVDTDNGIIIHIYNSDAAKEAERLFNERFPDGIIS